MNDWRRAFLLVIASATVGLASVAHAGDPSLARPTSTDAQEHLDHGNRFYAVRDFEKAVAEYKAGALIEPAPVFDYNLAQCYRQLGRYKDASWHYHRFLRYGHPQNPAIVQSVQQHLDQMQAEIDRKAMTQPPNDVAPSPSVAPTPSIVAQPGPPNSGAPWYADKFGWGLAGVGSVGLGVALGLEISAANLRSDADVATSQDERQRLRDSADTRDLVGIVIAVGGAGLLITGIIKLAVHSTPPPHRPALSWHIGIAPSSVVVVGRF